MKTIFIFAISRKWIGIARLPKALKEAGLRVIALCPNDSYLAKTQYLDELHSYKSNYDFQRLFRRIVLRNDIDLVIPGGDDEVLYLKQLINKRNLFPRNNSFSKRLLGLSYQNGEFEKLLNKSELQGFAEEFGISTPRNRVVQSVDEVLNELKNRTFPVVLKLDFGAAGSGVRICKSEEEVLKGYNELLILKNNRKLTQIVKEKIKELLDLPLFYCKQNISIQDYIKGIPCMHGVFASKGNVLSSVTLLKIKCYPEITGPSCVIQVVDNKKLASEVSRMIKSTGFSGFASFDFIITETNEGFLLECNPRPTPIMHLTHLLGGNLCQAVSIHLGETNLAAMYPEVIHPIIALFPNELKRDPQSPFARENYHDVPYDDHSLIEVFKRDLKKAGIQFQIEGTE